jgi:hypothetical protein
MTDAAAVPVEVRVDAAAEVVWGAFTRPEELRRWFGWDYDGLEAEIQYIFFDHATQHAPNRIEIEDEMGNQSVELVPDASGTIVRIVAPDALAEGWRTFFCQLGHYLEHHRGEERRTVHLDGEATPSAVLALLGDQAVRASGSVAVVHDDDGFAAVESSDGLDSREPGRVKLTVSTYGLDDEEVARVRRRWAERWRSATSR